MNIDPKVGGHYRLIISGNDFSSRNEGKFLIVEAPHHVRYTWEWSGDGEITEIDVVFATTTQGTEIQISHSGFTSQTSVDNHDSGWDSYIEGFIAHLNQL